MNWCHCCIASVVRHSFPEITVSTILNSVTQPIALVFLDVVPDECASYIRRVLRHRAFRTRAQRLGKVVRARPSGITYWQINQKVQHIQAW